MRNGNKTRQLLSLARIFVLALCFTLVFAVALSTIGSIDMPGTSIAANEDDNEAKGGIVSVTADQGPECGIVRLPRHRSDKEKLVRYFDF